MSEDFKIFIDRLSSGKEDELLFSFELQKKDIPKQGMSFPYPVRVSGKAYVADEYLVVHINLETKYNTQCKICNEIFEKPFSLSGYYLAEPLENISSRVYHLYDPLKDAILLGVPEFDECEGNCPQREHLSKYLK